MAATFTTGTSRLCVKAQCTRGSLSREPIFRAAHARSSARRTTIWALPSRARGTVRASHSSDNCGSKQVPEEIAPTIGTDVVQTDKQSNLERLGRIARIGACAVALVAVPSLIKVGTAFAAEETAVEVASSIVPSAKGASDTGLLELTSALDTAWVLISAYLVIFMNAGFAMVEAGMCRAKNCVNILAKNLIVFAIATLSFYLTGFGFLFGDGNGLMGSSGFMLGGPADNAVEVLTTGATYSGVFGALSETAVPLSAKFFFQVAFAGTAATIVSGAVAERIHFLSFCVFSALLVGISYAITGHWIWGGGWLTEMGFWDFAGCTTVHSVGGWAGLIGAWLLGPRIGKYGADSAPMPGHSLPLATLGCLILWLGWFGFNPGSTMAVDASAVAHIALTTNLGACAGAISASLATLVKTANGKVDLSMVINGVLGGLVSVTAACPWVSVQSAIIIGLIGGVVVAQSIDFFDSQKIDDPVSAISVHLGAGIWGTIATALFAEGPGALYAAGTGPERGLLLGGDPSHLVTQLVGIACVGAFTCVFSFIAWTILDKLIGLRVSREDELSGLDQSEHAQQAYHLKA